MDETILKEGLDTLDFLARAEYRQSLSEVAGDPDTHQRYVRLGRLVGVLLKKPFAEAQSLDQPSPYTAAYWSWELVDANDFEKQAAAWQYQVLAQIREELPPEYGFLQSETIYGLAQYAHNERGLFSLFALTLRKYICGNEAIRKAVEDAVEASGKIGTKIPVVTPEAIVGTGGLALGLYLVQNIPILGMVGAPGIDAVVIILYAIGVRAFCEWSGQPPGHDFKENKLN